MIKIHPKCLMTPESFISAHGIYFPCCWIAAHDRVNTIKEFLGPLFEQLDTKKYLISEIENSQAIAKIKESWEYENNEGTLCAKTCGVKPNDGSRQGNYGSIKVYLK